MIDIPKITATINTEETETVKLPPIVSTIETREDFVELPKVVANIRQETVIVGNLRTTVAGKGKDGKDGIDGKDGYTPVKGVDYFDGIDGKDGRNGVDGKDGKDGYTPIKGKDYFDGKDGRNGIDGRTPIKGVDYFDGADGRDGKDGKDGRNGRTPIKGIDYKDGKDGKDGINGLNGKDGLTPFINNDGYWQIGEKETGVSAVGVPGKDGADGKDGEDGKSAYQYAVENGFIGTEKEFAEYLSNIKTLDDLGGFEKNSNKTQDVENDKESETAYPSAKAVYKLGETVLGHVSQKVNNFHAAIDNSSFQYVKGSADFTYEQVTNTENCQIEVAVANEKIYLKKQEFKNINPPDAIAGRYVGFSNIIRVAGEMAELFLFVYDPENLPTDPASQETLATWGDYQYCVSSYQPIMMGNFLGKDISAERNRDNLAPSMKASGDYTDKQCGVVLDYMQTTFAQNIMALVQQTYGAHIIYDDLTGFEASNDDAGETWHLTGLNLSPYKRIKCYVCSGGDSDSNYSPEHIVEVHLDDRAKGSFGYFSATHTGHCQNNRNRLHITTFTVNAEKTAVQFQHSISLYGTAASNSSGGRRCYLIEGYLV